MRRIHAVSGCAVAEVPAIGQGVVIGIGRGAAVERHRLIFHGVVGTTAVRDGHVVDDRGRGGGWCGINLAVVHDQGNVVNTAVRVGVYRLDAAAGSAVAEVPAIRQRIAVAVAEVPGVAKLTAVNVVGTARMRIDLTVLRRQVVRSARDGDRSDIYRRHLERLGADRAILVGGPYGYRRWSGGGERKSRLIAELTAAVGEIPLERHPRSFRIAR